MDIRYYLLICVCTIFSCNYHPANTAIDFENEIENMISFDESLKALEKVNHTISAAIKSKDTTCIIQAYFYKGHYWGYLDNYDSSFVAYAKGVDLALACNDASFLPKAYERLASIKYLQRNYRDAYKYGKLSLNSAIQEKDSLYMGLSNYVLWAVATVEGNETEKAICLNEVVVIANKTKKPSLLAKSYKAMAISADVKGDLKMSLSLQKTELTLNESMGKEKDILQSNMNIAGVYNRLGDNYNAILYYQKALNLAEKLRKKLLITQLYQEIAILLIDSPNRLVEAKQNLEKAAQSLNDFESPMLKYKIERTKGLILKKEKDLKNASIQFHKAYAIAKQQNMYQSEGVCLFDICGVYFDMGRLDSAEFYAQKADAAYQKINAKDPIRNVTITLANIYAMQKKYDKAISMAMTELNNMNNIGLYTEYAKSIYHTLYISNKGLKKQDKALFYHEKLMTIVDSIANNNKIAETSDLIASIHFEREKRNKDIELYKLNKEIELKNQRKNILLIIISVLVLIGFYLFYLNSVIHNKKEKLVALNKEIADINANLEIIVIKKTKRLKENYENMILLLQTNSHDIRNHVARILGLLNLYEQNLAKTEFVMKNIQVSAEELDKSLTIINENLYKEIQINND